MPRLLNHHQWDCSLEPRLGVIGGDESHAWGAGAVQLVQFKHESIPFLAGWAYRNVRIIKRSIRVKV
jgi:hypothetical protein